MKVVFLHIPKTAGQSVRLGLRDAFGSENLDPLLSNSQTTGSCFASWDKYTVFTGHLNWQDLHRMPGDKFVFSILRQPRERLGSFYFYLRANARKLTAEEVEKSTHQNQRRILDEGPAGYFFDEKGVVRPSIRAHYDNFYASYFAQRTFQPRRAFFDLPDADRLRQAQQGLDSLDMVCTVDSLPDLERALKDATGKRVRLARTRKNVGPLAQGKSRWDALDTEVGCSKVMKKLERLCALDQVIYDAVAAQQRPVDTSLRARAGAWFQGLRP